MFGSLVSFGYFSISAKFMSLWSPRSLTTAIILTIPSSVFAQSVDSGSRTFIVVSAGYEQICAIDSEGLLVCNLGSAAQRLAPPENLPTLTTVEAGSVHACGLTWTGSAICWGDNDFGQLDVPRDVQFTTLSAGAFHTCGITTSNSVVCWGLNDNGQTAPRFDAELTNASDGTIQMASLDLADYASCGLDVNGFIHCWGDSLSTYRPQSSSSEASVDLNVEKFAVAKRQYPFEQQCGLLSDGTIDCLEDVYSFNGRYTDVAAHGRLMCGLDLDGDLECQAPSYEADQLLPWIVESIDQINDGDALVSIKGSFGMCGLTANGKVKCVRALNQIEPRIPGTEPFSPAAPDDLSVAIYSDTTVELLWSYSNIAPWRIAYVEIYRDGEVFTTTTQLSSYIDSSLEPGRSYSYSVRFVPISGINGEFSSTITVNTFDRNNPSQPSSDGYVPPERPLKPTDLQVSVYSQQLLEIQWSRVNDVVLGYEIRRDGQSMGYTTGVSFLDGNITSGSNYVYEVIAVTDDGQIQGVAMIRVDVQ